MGGRYGRRQRREEVGEETRMKGGQRIGGMEIGSNVGGVGGVGRHSEAEASVFGGKASDDPSSGVPGDTLVAGKARYSFAQ